MSSVQSGDERVPEPEVMLSLRDNFQTAQRRAKQLARDDDDDELLGETMIKAVWHCRQFRCPQLQRVIASPTLEGLQQCGVDGRTTHCEFA